MKIIIAPDKLKGSLSAIDFCCAAKEGIHLEYPSAEILKLPLADGGEGLVEILHYYLHGYFVETYVHDPLFRSIKAKYGVSNDGRTAYIEMAAASGLSLLSLDERNCNNTTTYGTGELILDAIKRGIKKIILGIGGSATQDAGIGMATALGYKFLDNNNNTVKPIGKNLTKIVSIDNSALQFDKKAINVTVACDVINVLYGKNGSAFFYAKQKGATDSDIIQLDKGLQNFARRVKQKYANLDLSTIKGGGAAGGLGAGSVLFLEAKLISGIDLLLKISQMKKYIKEANLIITGEGKLASQTFYGKVIKGISKICKNYPHIPLIGICGISELLPREEKTLGFDKIYQIIHPAKNEKDAMQNTYQYVKYLASQLMRENGHLFR